jgi:arginyl-tRNA synthetase
MTSFEGDTGPYLQYAHSRLCSIERKYVKQMHNDSVHSVFDYNYECDCEEDLPSVSETVDLDRINFSLLTEPQAHALAYQIGQYPYAIQGAYRLLEASTIVNYLFNLCHAISSANSALNVLNAPQNVKDARLMLFHAARVVLGDGLRLLGLKPLEKM